MDLFKKLMKVVLLYNTLTQGQATTKSNENVLDAFHRKQRQSERVEIDEGNKYPNIHREPISFECKVKYI